MVTEITTPVLYLVFNRPEKTQLSFNAIRDAKPSKLYIAVDAPRKDVKDDVVSVNKVKQIVSKVDWDCDVKYLFHDNNLGCSLAGKTAWDWIFEQEEDMIFIEDDGVVTNSFFYFCQTLLEKYRNNKKVAYIGGVNYGVTYGDASFFFSRYNWVTYGMATWKRVYDLYDYKLETYKETKDTDSFKASFLYNFEYKYFERKFLKYINKGGNTYDVQMAYLCYKYNMYNIVPNVNLVSNIGLDFGGANNSVSPDSKIAKKYGNRPTQVLNNIVFPDEIYVSEEFEKKYLLKRIYNDKSLFQAVILSYIPILNRIYNKLLRILKMN